MNQADIKYPDVHVRLVGMDGNAYAIMGRVQEALRNHGVSDKEVKKYLDESMSGDYDHLLRTAMKWVNTNGSDEDDDDPYYDEDDDDE